MALNSFSMRLVAADGVFSRLSSLWNCTECAKSTVSQYSHGRGAVIIGVSFVDHVVCSWFCPFRSRPSGKTETWGQMRFRAGF